MVPRELLRKAAGKVRARAQALEFRLHGAVDLGEIVVAGEKVGKLVPLGHKPTPGITKAGRLSLSGECNGRKVKVFTAFNASQVALRRALGNVDLGACRFPSVIAADDDTVVEEWVQGPSLADAGDVVAARAESAVNELICTFRARPDMLELSVRFAGSFDYFDDYLVARLRPWSRLAIIQDYLASWQANRTAMLHVLPARVCHPDLSRANILHDAATGRFVIVDNELLGVGQGWLLDRLNSFVCHKGNEPELEDFTAQTWGLRKLGSALYARDLPAAMAIAGGRIPPD